MLAASPRDPSLRAARGVAIQGRQGLPLPPLDCFVAALLAMAACCRADAG